MSDDGPLTLLGRRLPQWAQVRIISIAPGARRPYDESEWGDALVVVEQGEVVLECASGRRTRFKEGAVLCLTDLPLRTLCNDCPDVVVLSALTRRRPQAETAKAEVSTFRAAGVLTDMTNEPASPSPPVPAGTDTTKTVTSADGTGIAFDQFGAGPPIIMAAGAFNTRSATQPLARVLSESCTVINFDRRGRGDSGDTEPYAVEREIEDLAALIGHAGGSAAIFGYSSGGNLALKAAGAGLSITHLVLYEPPFRTAPDDPGLPQDFPQQLGELIEADRRGDAVELYQAKAVRIPPPVVAQMRESPFRPQLEAIAHTLVYDATIVGDLALPSELISSIATPTLVLCGAGTSPFMKASAAAVAHALPAGQLRELPSQGHGIDAEATGPFVAEFLRTAAKA